jgi:hypothetical protein
MSEPIEPADAGGWTVDDLKGEDIHRDDLSGDSTDEAPDEAKGGAE